MSAHRLATAVSRLSQNATFVRRLSQNATFVRSLSQNASFVRAAKDRVRSLFTRYLLLTNTALSLGLAGTGDVLNQRYEIVRGVQEAWSPERSRNQCAQGALFGPLYHYWYILLERTMPGHGTYTVLRKVVVDQIVMVPISVALFLIVVGSLEGQRRDQISRDMRAKAPPLLAAEWTLGPVTQLVNFHWVPPRFRVLYDCLVGLCFDSYYSHIKYRRDVQATPTSSQGTSSASQTTPTSSKATPASSQTTHTVSQTTPTSSKATPTASQTTPTSSQATPAAQDISTHPRSDARVR